MNLKSKIKLLFISAVLTAGLFSCGPKEETLQDKKATLSKLKSEFIDLQTKINQLQKEIELESRGQDDGFIVNVDALKIVPITFRREIQVQGTVESDRVSVLSSMVGGNIIGIYVQEGSIVKKGQLMLQVDDSRLQKSLNELMTRLEFAEDVYNRQKRLWEKKAGSEMQYLQAKNNYEAMLKSKESLEEQIKNTKIIAPFAGYIDYIFPKIGELLMPGMPAIKLTDMNNVKIAADISESYLSTIRKGIPVTVSLSEINSKETGKIINAARSIDVKNRTFRIEIKLDKNPPGLRPYQVCGITINDVTKENALTVPIANVRRSGDKFFVFKIDEENMTAKKTFIKTGLSNDVNVEIIDGLKENDRIITNGALDVTNGQKIKIVTEK